jgi:ADP-ribose pyrophosphatase YjhB (NUDIX family)
MAHLTWNESYLGQLRNAVGDQKLINVACRGIILDQNNKVLLVKRVDNGKWVMPAGSMELNESAFEGLQREVHEETGLEVKEGELIAIYSDPSKYSYESWGFQYRILSFVFLVTKWSGTLQSNTNETTNACFFDLEDLPLSEIPQLYIETLEDLTFYKETGKVIVK